MRIIHGDCLVEMEIDDGPCPECHGECVLEVSVQRLTLADVEAMHDGESRLEPGR